ncbi:hypothetical protein Harman_16280 [Haloarcula mannanilytica]|uniref:Putative peptidase inhibitor domain-containing protein n=1 Tax=Haloarcula mannanilytica TaxID=2509225 RepID=A0A4C2EM40_9EURY|nr:hypothetical protein [Haloarcula mannanilytica]GCF13693.1 hypothetical protein Harman_16280 [Haloarcula mannanilytica]
MYVSRAVESLRDDPIEGEPVELVLETAADADPESVAAAAAAAGATVERHLQFDDLLVSTTQDEIDALCDLDGLAAIQTGDVNAITTVDDVEEDIDPGD